MADVLYLVGVDPAGSAPIVSTPVLSDRFIGAPVYDRIRDAVDDIAENRQVRLHTDWDGVQRMRRVLAESGRA